MRTLLKYGADINAKGCGGSTPLHRALRPKIGLRGSTTESSTTDDTVNVLLNKGAKTDVKDGQGQTPLEIAAAGCKCSYDIYKRLLLQCTDDKVLTRLIFKVKASDTTEDKIRFIQDLQSMGVNLESRNGQGRIPLLAAASDPMAQVMKALLE